MKDLPIFYRSHSSGRLCGWTTSNAYANSLVQELRSGGRRSCNSWTAIWTSPHNSSLIFTAFDGPVADVQVRIVVIHKAMLRFQAINGKVRCAPSRRSNRNISE